MKAHAAEQMAATSVSQPAIAVLSCPKCELAQLPEPDRTPLVCPFCGAVELERSTIPGFGLVVAASRVHVSATGDPPFVVVALRVDRGILVFARWDHADPPGAGSWARVTLDDEIPLAAAARQGAVPEGLSTRVGRSAERAHAACESLVRPRGLGRGQLDVRVAGVGMTDFGKSDEPAGVLATRAVASAVGDAGIGFQQVDAVFGATGFDSSGVAQQVATALPLSGRPAFNLENACAGGTSALLQAAAWLDAGGGDVAVVFGVDRMASRGGSVPLSGGHSLLRTGALLPVIYALSGSKYLDDWGYTREELAQVVRKSRHHAAANPLAYKRHPVEVADVVRARPIADPLALLDCCPNADGAAAAVLVRGPSRAASKSIHLRSGTTMGGMRREKVDSPGITRAAAGAAYELAGLGPDDVSVAEVHDAFSPAEPLAIEALGFTGPGQALRGLVKGEFSLGGEGVTVNPSGGLLSRGHPPGATGLAQVCEIVTQLRGDAGVRQADGARVGLVHNQGGSVLELDTNACSVLILST